MKISEIIDKLEAYHGPLEPERRTCDIVQYGDPDQICTGIVLSCCPTAEVIRKAAELGCNLIIGHEPLFYDGWDETDWLQDNCVYQAKNNFLTVSVSLYTAITIISTIIDPTVSFPGWLKCSAGNSIRRRKTIFREPRTTCRSLRSARWRSMLRIPCRLTEFAL